MTAPGKRPSRSVLRAVPGHGDNRYEVRCDGDCIPMMLGEWLRLDSAREHAQKHFDVTGCRTVIWQVVATLIEAVEPIENGPYLLEHG